MSTMLSKLAVDTLWHDPSEDTELRLDPRLLDAGVFDLEVVAEAERDDGKTRRVVLRVCLGEALECNFDLARRSALDRPVIVRKKCVVARILQSASEKARLGQVVLHDTAVAVEAEVQDWDQILLEARPYS